MERVWGIAAGAHNDTETVYQVVKTIYDHHDEWKSVHPIARRWNVKHAIDNAVQPFHEGAVRYYKEKGIWDAQMEAKQKELLNQ